MDKYVLDTNLFFNMEPGLGIGKKTQEVVEKTTVGIKSHKKKGREFYMPPRIVEEFLSFFEDKEQGFIKEFLAEIAIKSPDVSQVTFAADAFYKIVDDIRKRSYLGLKVAEEALKKAAQDSSQINKTQQDFEKAIGPTIKNLRDRYRNATRVGFLDSVADLDLIVLAKELQAKLITTDEGVVRWGRVFGVHEMEAQAFGRLITMD